jgi:hypothetical protein
MAKLLETSIGVIENANYLSLDQKQDIFFNNAVHFFKLDESIYKQWHSITAGCARLLHKVGL